MFLTECLFHMLLSKFLTYLIWRRQNRPRILTITSSTVGFYHLSLPLVIHKALWQHKNRLWQKDEWVLTSGDKGCTGIVIQWKMCHKGPVAFLSPSLMVSSQRLWHSYGICSLTRALFCAQAPVIPVPSGLYHGLGANQGRDWVKETE